MMENAGKVEKGRPIDLGDCIRYASGSIVSRTLLHKEAGTLTLFAFDEGQRLSEHTAPFDAVVQVLDGEARLMIGAQEVKVRAGALVIMPANVPHSVKAEKKFKMLLTMIRS